MAVGKGHLIQINLEGEFVTTAPTVHIRDGLVAQINRSVYYQLANLMVQKDDRIGIWSSGAFYGFEKL